MNDSIVDLLLQSQHEEMEWLFSDSDVTVKEAADVTRQISQEEHHTVSSMFDVSTEPSCLMKAHSWNNVLFEAEHWTFDLEMELDISEAISPSTPSYADSFPLVDVPKPRPDKRLEEHSEQPTAATIPESSWDSGMAWSSEVVGLPYQQELEIDGWDDCVVPLSSTEYQASRTQLSRAYGGFSDVPECSMQFELAVNDYGWGESVHASFSEMEDSLVPDTSDCIEPHESVMDLEAAISRDRERKALIEAPEALNIIRVGNPASELLENGDEWKTEEQSSIWLSHLIATSLTEISTAREAGSKSTLKLLSRNSKAWTCVLHRRCLSRCTNADTSAVMIRGSELCVSDRKSWLTNLSRMILRDLVRITTAFPV
ncbi:hypothetical protein DFJ77DRAFT_151487 [Powellomyces hirtus]|nr:hypothetical protein DFJ77DRAFT_151487 [Powellomyces hirtus]